MTLVVEPWGREYALPPKGKIRVEFSGSEGEPEVAVDGDRIFLYGWNGTMVRVDHGQGFL